MKHEANCKNIQAQMMKDKYNQLKKSLKEQNIFKAQSFSTNLAVKASYIVSQILAKKMKPFADGEIIKECLTAVAEMGLSRFTIGRKIEQLKDSKIFLQLYVNILKNFNGVPHNGNIGETSQLAIFVRGIDSNFNITEELSSSMPMTGTTTRKDLYNELKSLLENSSIPLEKHECRSSRIVI